MPGHLALACLSLLLLLPACRTACPPTPTAEPPGSAARPGDARQPAEEAAIEGGRDYGPFRATSSSVVELAEGTQVTPSPEADGRVVYLINNGAAGGLRCRCDSGCSGACEARVGDTVATCSGTCSGLSDDGRRCSSCTWHYDRRVRLGGAAGEMRAPR